MPAYAIAISYWIKFSLSNSLGELSFLQPLGHAELDLPDAPEKAAPQEEIN